MSDVPELLILGLGNVLCADDGAGVAAVVRLARERSVPPGVWVLDGGTLGLSLLPLVESGRDVILVDAVRTEAPPGTLVRLEGDDVLPAALERLESTTPFSTPEAVVVLVELGAILFGGGLAGFALRRRFVAPVASAPRAVSRVFQFAACLAFGAPLAPRPPPVC